MFKKAIVGMGKKALGGEEQVRKDSEEEEDVEEQLNSVGGRTGLDVDL